MLNKGTCNMNVPYKTCELYWVAVGAPEHNEDHNFNESITTKKTFRMTGINFFPDL
jgi:hypothetical protein